MDKKYFHKPKHRCPFSDHNDDVSGAAVGHLAREFLELSDLLVWRLALGNRLITALHGSQEYAAVLLLSVYFKSKTMIIRKNTPPLTDMMSRLLPTLAHAHIIGDNQSIPYDNLTKILGLLIGVRKMTIRWNNTQNARPLTESTSPVLHAINAHMEFLTCLTLFDAKIEHAHEIIFKAAIRLKVLELNNCSFKGDSERSLSQLTGLYSLKLSNPQFIESLVPSENYLIFLTQLNNLSLEKFNGRDIRDIESLSKLHYLKYLTIDNTEALTDDNIRILLALEGLCEISLIGCYEITLNGVEQLSSLKDLKSLAIRYTDTWFSNDERTNLGLFTSFTRLKSLSLEGNEDIIDDDYGASSPGITNEALADIGKMTWLTRLSIDASPADYGCLKQLATLTSLVHLTLYVLNNIKDMEIGFLKNLLPTSLTCLRLLNMDLELMNELYNHRLPNLTCLDLSATTKVDDWRLFEDGERIQQMINNMPSELTIKQPI